LIFLLTIGIYYLTYALDIWQITAVQRTV